MGAEVPDFVGRDGVPGPFFGFPAVLCDEHHRLHRYRGHALGIDARTQFAYLTGGFHQLGEQGQQRRVGNVHLRGMRDKQSRREVGEQRTLCGRVWSRGLE